MSPVNPFAHVQVYEPCVFIHVAPFWQLSVPAVHSLISVEEI